MKVEFNQLHLRRIQQALSRVLLVAGQEREDMPKRGAKKYSDNVINAISGQKYGWPDHSIYYKSWKYLHNYDPRKWVLKGDLLQAIDAHKLPSKDYSQYLGGILQKSKDNGGKSFFGKGASRSIVWYGKMLEYGRKGQLPRPLFVPEFESFKGLWKLEMYRSKAELRRAWR